MDCCNLLLRRSSVSYHTPARDAFVGWLFVVGAFLMAYEGHYFYEGVASKVASAMAFLVAISPTECSSIAPSKMCELAPTVNIHAEVHQSAAALLFIILAFFCLGPFRRRAASKTGINAKIRRLIYWACGIAMLGAMAYIVIEAKTPYKHPRAVFYGEVVALSAFGIAWIVAGQYFNFVPNRKNNES